MCVVHGLGPWGKFLYWVEFFFFWRGGGGGGGVFLQEIILVVALQRSVMPCLLVMSQCKIGIVIMDL